MDIYILRHAEAHPRSDDVPEADRKLTSKGKRDAERIARWAQAIKVQPDVVLTSPYARAKETAVIARQAFNPKPLLVETPVLLPSGSTKQVWKEISSHSRARQLLLVGHEPQLSELVAFLLASPQLRLDLKKGALVRIRMDQLGPEPYGELKWVQTSGLIRTAGKL